MPPNPKRKTPNASKIAQKLLKKMKTPEVKENKCICGEQTTFGNADVEIDGVCHRTQNPCYIIEPQKSIGWEERIDIQAITEKDGVFYLAIKTSALKDDLEVVTQKYIKNLLSQARQEEREKMVEWCKEMEKSMPIGYCMKPDCCIEEKVKASYNQALSDIQAHIKSLIGENKI